MQDPTRVGAAVRSARLQRGMSQHVLAGLAGRGQPWLSKIERGLLPLERRQDLRALSDALAVSPAELTGQPYDPDDRTAGGAQATVPAIRRAVLDSPAPGAEPLEALAVAVEEMTVRRQAFQLEQAGSVLPGLLLALRGRPEKDAARLRCWVWYEGASLVRDLGHGDLALLMLDRFADDADLAGDAALAGAAAFVRVHTLASTPVGAVRAAAAESDRASSEVEAPQGQESVAALGGLLLAGSFAHAAAGSPGEAVARLDEAEALAGHVTGPSVVARHNIFVGPNVALHRIMVSVEVGDPDAAARAADETIPAQLGAWPARVASYWADLGRAYAQLQRDDEAVRALRLAEQVSPLRVRLHPLVREAVGGMVQRAHERAVGRDLRGLAYRMGVQH